MKEEEIYNEVARNRGWKDWDEVKQQNHWTIHRLRQEAKAIIYKQNNPIITKK